LQEISKITIKLRERLDSKHLIQINFPRGSFAIVKKGVNKKTGEKVAIKIISK
jgi:serine/threonine protein kinase